MTVRSINKTVLFCCLVLVLMAFTTPGSNQFQSIESTNPKPEFNTCEIENTSFQVGEEIVYKIFYNWNFIWLAAGEVTFKVTEKDRQYHFSATGRTYSSYEWFYKIRDYYDTYVDKQTLLPELSIRDINEGKYRLYDKITFDQSAKKAASLRGKTKEEAKLTTYDIDPCMHDILSIFYYTRNLDFNNLKQGTTIPIKIFIDKEVWPLKLEYRGKDANKKIKGLGRFKTIKFGPEVIEGYYFKKDTQMNVWVTDDNNKIPVMIESPVSVGSIKVVLKSYKNLRHDFAAQVERENNKDTNDGE